MKQTSEASRVKHPHLK